METLPPFSVWEVLAQEHFEFLGTKPDAVYETLRDAWRNNPSEATEKALRDYVVSLLHGANRSALCFSGGGIRSATLGLGVLQGLAGHSTLTGFDYLSTVSGGGYLGSWYSSWAAREPDGAEEVARQLAAVPQQKLDPEPKPLRHLRAYSNYLSPKLGALSADTWTLACTVVRNILLNWLVLLPLLAAVLVIPRLMFALNNTSSQDWTSVLLWCGFGFGALSTAYLVYDLPSAGNAQGGQARYLMLCLLPLSLSAAALVLYWDWHVKTAVATHGWKQFIGFSLAMLAAGMIIGAPFAIRSATRDQRQASVNWMARGFLAFLLAGVFGGLGTYGLTRIFDDVPHQARIYTCLAFPSLMLVFVLAQFLLVGFTSRITTDDDREWWARSGAWILIVVVAWAAFAAVVLYGPAGFLWLKSAVATAVGAIASRLGFTPKTSAGRREEEQASSPQLPKSKKLTEIGAKLVLPVFLVLLIMSLATLNQTIGELLFGMQSTPWSELLLIAVLAVPGLVMARFINANWFSLGAMYRARLIRCYLGASNNARSASGFTGFDPNDNVRMADLKAKPLHVVNIALNLVKGKNLAWQQRKAESFTVSRLHSGSCRVGYQPSKTYLGGITLGTAVAISGAAASPNMGYHSSALLTLVMTLFNARLGAWFANPGKHGKGVWHTEGPTYAVRSFIDEAFGLTTDDNTWVYLSDGGHFENLAIYEMVLRRCRTIVVVDGGCDTHYTYEDLGNAVRKIRVDMGIPIEFEHGIPISAKHEPTGRHCALGTIGYSCVDADARDGDLLYIKASLNGNEPPDVTNYAATNVDFPHQTTGDQFFDEAQFESYRRLGSHIVEEICGPGRVTFSAGDLVRQVREHYLKPAAKVAQQG